MKYRHLAAALLLLAIVAGAWSYASGHTQAQNTALAQCPRGIGITKPFNADTVSGIITLEATASTSYGVQSVTFLLNNQLSYTGQRIDPYWRASVDTAAAGLANGPYNLSAKVMLTTTELATGTAYECMVPPMQFTVANPPAVATVVRSLSVVPSLQSWAGPTNVSFDVVLKTVLRSGTIQTDISQQAGYDWSTSKGILSPQGYRATLNSGPTSGEGTIKVRVSYGELSQEVSIPLKIQSASTSTTYPTVVKSDGTTTATQSNASQDQPKSLQTDEANNLFQTALNRNGQGDAELERCLATTLGEAEYQQRIKQQPRLGFAEITKTEQCFVRRSSVIPANLAPVEPSKVPNLPVAKNVKLQQFEKVTKNGKDVLQISGQAEPNKTVVIYVFSEPLVLVAKADKDGKWNYVLEDPMQPGNHQAYVTVEGDNNQTVRSDGFGFAVVAAPKTKLNPLGLSFAIQQADKPKLFFGVYIGAAVLLVAVALGTSIWILRRKSKPPQSPPAPQPPVAV